MEQATGAIREFLTWWLMLFGVSDPAYVQFGMALVAGFALLMAICLVLGILGGVIDLMKG